MRVLIIKRIKKILIFYASYGGGHLNAAKSIKECIDKNYTDCESELIDCMKYVNKPIEKITTTAYKEMANSDHTISEVAMNNGFPSSKAFAKAFSKKYGLLPSEYRKLKQVKK